MKRIAYLAPEIPALSATFVYNEILGIQKKGYHVTPISVHKPKKLAQDKGVEQLRRSTFYLYDQGLAAFLLSACSQLVNYPVRTIQVLRLLFHDVWKVGLFSRTGIGLGFRFTAACMLARILRANNCEHLHIHFAHIPTDIGMYASILSNIPFSFTAHANDLFERGWLLQEKVNRSKFTITISEYNRRWLRERGCNSSKIHIVRCGINSSRFTPIHYKNPASPFRIGTIGRMVEKKGFDTLIKATAILKQKGLPLYLMIVGSGPLEKHLRDLAEKLQIKGLVEFPGPIINQDVPSWLRTLDLFVLPCQKDHNGDMDGIPVVLMEAMLSGVPVVSTNISGIPELVINNLSGLLVPPQDPEALSLAMKRLLLDYELRETTYKNAIKHIRFEFNEELNVNRLHNLISS